MVVGEMDGIFAGGNFVERKENFKRRSPDPWEKGNG